MCGSIPPLPLRLHGVVLSQTQGQLYLQLMSKKYIYMRNTSSDAIY